MIAVFIAQLFGQCIVLFSRLTFPSPKLIPDLNAEAKPKYYDLGAFPTPFVDVKVPKSTQRTRSGLVLGLVDFTAIVRW